MGSHTAYRKRYPKEFEKYSGKTDQEQTIAEYHNSILYNDFVVDSFEQSGLSLCVHLGYHVPLLDAEGPCRGGSQHPAE